MLRSALLVCATVTALAVVAPGHARADTGTLDIQLGGLQLTDQAGDVHGRPTIRTDFAFDLVGSTLQAGGYFQITSEAFPLKRPGLAGGVLVALRPEIESIGLRPILEASIGRMQLPVAQMQQEVAWVSSLAGGLGVRVSDELFLEARLTHQWLHALPEDSAIRARTWTVTAGFGIEL
jgi:hypothetical protein